MMTDSNISEELKLLCQGMASAESWGEYMNLAACARKICQEQGWPVGDDEEEEGQEEEPAIRDYMVTARLYQNVPRCHWDETIQRYVTEDPAWVMDMIQNAFETEEEARACFLELLNVACDLVRAGSPDIAMSADYLPSDKQARHLKGLPFAELEDARHFLTITPEFAAAHPELTIENEVV